MLGPAREFGYQDATVGVYGLGAAPPAPHNLSAAQFVAASRANARSACELVWWTSPQGTLRLKGPSDPKLVDFVSRVQDALGMPVTGAIDLNTARMLFAFKKNTPDRGIGRDVYTNISWRHNAKDTPGAIQACYGGKHFYGTKKAPWPVGQVNYSAATRFQLEMDQGKRKATLPPQSQLVDPASRLKYLEVLFAADANNAAARSDIWWTRKTGDLRLSGPADPKLVAVLANWQRALDLPATGAADRATMTLLRALIVAGSEIGQVVSRNFVFPKDSNALHVHVTGTSQGSPAYRKSRIPAPSPAEAVAAGRREVELRHKANVVVADRKKADEEARRRAATTASDTVNKQAVKFGQNLLGQTAQATLKARKTSFDVAAALRFIMPAVQQRYPTASVGIVTKLEAYAKGLNNELKRAGESRVVAAMAAKMKAEEEAKRRAAAYRKKLAEKVAAEKKRREMQARGAAYREKLKLNLAERKEALATQTAAQAAGDTAGAQQAAAQVAQADAAVSTTTTDIQQADAAAQQAATQATVAAETLPAAQQAAQQASTAVVAASDAVAQTQTAVAQGDMAAADAAVAAAIGAASTLVPAEEIREAVMNASIEQARVAGEEAKQDAAGEDAEDAARGAVAVVQDAADKAIAAVDEKTGGKGKNVGLLLAAGAGLLWLLSRRKRAPERDNRARPRRNVRGNEDDEACRGLSA